MIDLRSFADDELEDRIDLVVGTGGPIETFDQRQLRPLLYDHDATRVGRSRWTWKYVCELDRLADARSFFDPERDAPRHKRGVKRNSDVVFAGDEPVRRILSHEGEKLAQDNARIRRTVVVAPARFIPSVDDSDPARLDARQIRHDALRGGRFRKRLGLAYQRTQVGVFPFLDAPMRQAARIKATERVVAQRNNRSLAGQLAARGRKSRTECLLGRRLHGAHIRGHPAASPWNWA